MYDFVEWYAYFLIPSVTYGHILGLHEEVG